MENQSSFDNQNKIKPNNNMPLAIISTVLGCCSPIFIGFIIGIVSIVFATQVNTKYNAGDYLGAEKAAKLSKILSYVSLGLVLVNIIIGIYKYSTGDFHNPIEDFKKGWEEGYNSGK